MIVKMEGADLEEIRRELCHALAVLNEEHESEAAGSIRHALAVLESGVTKLQNIHFT